MEVAIPSSASYAWQSILRGREVIQRGAIWRIGDGKTALLEAKVCNLIELDQNCWNSEVIDSGHNATL